MDAKKKIRSKLACKNCKFCSERNYFKSNCVAKENSDLVVKDFVAIQKEDKDQVVKIQSKQVVGEPSSYSIQFRLGCAMIAVL